MLLQRDHGVTLVVVTHDPTVSTRADRVLHMLDGRIEVTATEDRATDTGVAPPAAIGV